MKTRVSLMVLLLVALSLSLSAQTFISAKAGLVNYQEGVLSSSPHQLQEGEGFTSASRSEVLMMPGTYLRLAQGAEIQMGSTQLSHPSIELKAGLASVEVNEISKDSSLTISWHEFTGANSLVVDHKGLYRFEVSTDGDALKVMVQNGHLRIPGTNSVLVTGQESVLGATGGTHTFAKFDVKSRDDFDIWSANRSGALSAASYKTASSMSSAYPANSVWAYSPFGGFYTYLPYGRAITNPYGWGYYWPGNVYDYAPVYYNYYGGGGGYSGTRGTPSQRGDVASASFAQRPTPRFSPSAGNNNNNGRNGGYDASSSALPSSNSGSFSGSTSRGGNSNFGGSIGGSSSGSLSGSAAASAPGAAGGRRQ